MAEVRTPSSVGAGTGSPPQHDDRDTDRRWALDQLKRKRKLRIDVAAYIVVNAFLVVIWAVTGRGGFWPGWVMSGWAVLLLIDAAGIYLRRPITDADIERELRRRR